MTQDQPPGPAPPPARPAGGTGDTIHDGFNLNGGSATHTFIQWKGTDVCMDFRCDCGADGHIDADFVYYVKCLRCNTVWEMPSILYPRKLTVLSPYDICIVDLEPGVDE